MALAAGLPPPLGALGSRMVLGDGAALPAKMTDDFRATGLKHLVAASGANVALLIALVLGLCGLIGAPWRADDHRPGAVAAYVPVWRAAARSILRAGIMGRRGHRRRSLASNRAVAGVRPWGWRGRVTFANPRRPE